MKMKNLFKKVQILAVLGMSALLIFTAQATPAYAAGTGGVNAYMLGGLGGNTNVRDESNNLLADDCILEFIDAGANNVADEPNPDGSPGGDDGAVTHIQFAVGDGSFDNPGTFIKQAGGIPDGTKIFVRAWNANDINSADKYGDSDYYTIVGGQPEPPAPNWEVPDFATTEDKPLPNQDPDDPTNLRQSVGNGAWINSGSITFTISMSDPNNPEQLAPQISYNVDGNGWSSVTTGDYESYAGSAIDGDVTISSATIGEGSVEWRARTKDDDNATSNYVTASETFGIDFSAPDNPTGATEVGGAQDNTWQSLVNNPNFTWTEPGDNGQSGISGYSVYWGTDSNGEPGTTQEQINTGYNPGAVNDDGNPRYLRVRTFDNAGNYSSPATLFTFKYDGTAPTINYTIPDNGDDNQPVSLPSIKAYFNTDASGIDPTTLTPLTVYITAIDSHPTTPNLSGNQLTFNHTGTFSNSETVTCTIVGGSSGVKDLAGNPLASNYVWTFEIIPPNTPDIDSIENMDGGLNYGYVYDSMKIVGQDFGADPGPGDRDTATENITIDSLTIPDEDPDFYDAEVWYWNGNGQEIQAGIPREVNGNYIAAGDLPVTVTAGGQTSTSVNFEVRPKIYSIDPPELSGPVGSTVVIYGTAYGSIIADEIHVYFNGVEANISSVVHGQDNDEITVTVPDTTSGQLLVEVNGKTSNTHFDWGNEDQIYFVITAPEVDVDPTAVPFSATQGENPSPNDETITIENTGDAVLTSWTADLANIIYGGNPSGWIVNIDPLTGGPINPGSTNTFDITLDDVSGFAVGTYTATIPLNFSQNLPSQNVVVTLTINPIDAPNVTSADWNLVGAANQINAYFTYGTLDLSGSNFTEVGNGSIPSGCFVDIKFAGQATYTNLLANDIYYWEDGRVQIGIPESIISGAGDDVYAQAGTFSVQVRTPSGSSTYSSSITTLRPRVYSITPTEGSEGTSVTINGTAFGEDGSDVTVYFDEQDTIADSASNTTANVTVPAGLPIGEASFIVEIDGQMSNSHYIENDLYTAEITFTVTEAVNPTVTNIAPNTGIQGETLDVIISGTDVTWSGDMQTAIHFGSGADIEVDSATGYGLTIEARIFITAGAIVGDYDVTVDDADESATFTVVDDTAPVLNSITPDTGEQAETLDVVLAGSNVDWTAIETSNIQFSPAGNITVNSVIGTETTIDAEITIAGTATLGDYTVTVDGASGSVIFTVTETSTEPATAPTISAIAPDNAYVGQTIVISGSNFGASIASSTVTVGGISANPTAWSDAQITLAVPSGVATDDLDLVVTVDTETATESITINSGGAYLDDFEGGSAGSFAGNGLVDSGYYVFENVEDLTPVDTDAMNTDLRQAEALKHGALGAKVMYSYNGVDGSDWGGGWGAIVSNTLDLSSYDSISFFVSWDGSGNEITLNLKDSDGTATAATISNTTLLSLGGYGKLTINTSAFAIDEDGSDPDHDGSFDWSQVTNYNILYKTLETSTAYHYIDSIHAGDVDGGPEDPIEGDVIITSVDPNSAPAGTKITINGQGFDATQGQNILLLENNDTGVSYQMDIVSWGEYVIEATIPRDATLTPDNGLGYELRVIKLAIVAGSMQAMESNTEGLTVTANVSANGIATVYPNPFNPISTDATHNQSNISYDAGSATSIGIYIYDRTARLVYHTTTTAASLTWDGKDTQGNYVADGVYLLRVVNNDNKSLLAKGKILVVKQ